eukprot:CAMPEP_0117641878 /NCGR_PEP_ID=MMETSP0802-20121206/9580_1 /TAXON_ID=38833 /ORGANISM="Micromonas sp., Strain CCMP2099" /LENGTH=122 /DNA_ID=CAMNT_0005446877 /DNA_START=173 /DNA_END=541 /DNA_ORIENTATION=+
MALLSGSMNFEIMWCLWKWCAITVTISCVALKSMMSMTAGLSVVARLNSFASRLLSFAVVVTSSSQYVRMIHGTSRHTSRKNCRDRALASGRVALNTGAPAGALRPWLVASRDTDTRSAIGH